MNGLQITTKETRRSKMEMSSEINELFEALSKAQGDLTNAARDSSSDVGYKYAQLGQMIDLCRKPLKENDLSIIQMPSAADETCSLTTMVTHKSGQWLRETLTMPVIIPLSNAGKETMNHGQAVGNAITYMRKYSLAGFMNIAQEDTDNASGEGGAKKFVNTSKKASAPQIKFVEDLIDQKWNIQDFRDKFKVMLPDELTASAAREAIEYIKSMTSPQGAPAKEPKTKPATKDKKTPANVMDFDEEIPF